MQGARELQYYESLLKSPSPPHPRCDKHAALSETPVGCGMCAAARRAWVEVLRRVAEERLEASKVHATEEATRLREASWEAWAAGDERRAAQLAEMRADEARAKRERSAREKRDA
jgi:hypothetical protein